jgi:hypothetical protein
VPVLSPRLGGFWLVWGGHWALKAPAFYRCGKSSEVDGSSPSLTNILINQSVTDSYPTKVISVGYGGFVTTLDTVDTARREWHLTGAHFWWSNDLKWPDSGRRAAISVRRIPSGATPNGASTIRR